MDLLLDTHILLWWLSGDPRLSATTRDAIAQPERGVFVSAATAWEIVIKRSLNKLRFEGELESIVSREGFAVLPIHFSHAEEVRLLPSIHQDPFDRMLVAQARIENLRLVSADRRVLQYPVSVLSC